MFFEMMFGYLISALIGAMVVVCVLAYLVVSGELVIESTDKRKEKKERKAAKKAERQKMLKELMQKQVDEEPKLEVIETPKKKK